MFSVLIPLYNKASHINKAIDSIIQQTFQDFEIIVVNDGSTDNSLEILNSIVEKLKFDDIDNYKKITVINQINQGVSTARNKAAKIAKYEFLAFLDADDWWESTYLNEMNILINEHPDAGLWASSFFVVKNNSKRLVRLGLEPHFTKGIINYFKVYAETLEMPVWTGATIIKKTTFYENNGFKSQIAFGEDFDLWIRVALKYSIAYLNIPLSNYNFDVDLKDRAVVNNVIYPPKKHFIFNLDYLSEVEKTNEDLKKLLDALRVYCLFPYYFKKVYQEEYKIEITKVNFSNFPLRTRLKFKLPFIIIRVWEDFKFFISENIIKRYS